MALQIHTDGGSRGNPGPSAAAAWFPQLNIGISKFIPHTTNNFAEYEGLIIGLNWALVHEYRNVFIWSDSKLMVNQVNGLWQVKSEYLLEQLVKVEMMRDEFFHEFTIQYFPRAQNVEADRLCNESMDQNIVDKKESKNG